MFSEHHKSCSACAQVRPAAQFSKNQQRKPDLTRKCTFCVQQRLQQGAHAAGFRRQSHPQTRVAQSYTSFPPQATQFGGPTQFAPQATQFGGPTQFAPQALQFGAAAFGGGGGFEDQAAPMECEIDSEILAQRAHMRALATFSAKDPRARVLVQTAMCDTGNDVSAAMQKLQLLQKLQKQRKAAQQSLAHLQGSRPEYKPTVAAALSAASGDCLAAWSALKPALTYLANCQKTYGRQGQRLVQQAFTASGMDAIKAARTVQSVIAQQQQAQPAVSIWGASSIATAA